MPEVTNKVGDAGFTVVAFPPFASPISLDRVHILASRSLQEAQGCNQMTLWF
jgi:hypothetical protein